MNRAAIFWLVASCFILGITSQLLLRDNVWAAGGLQMLSVIILNVFVQR